MYDIIKEYFHITLKSAVIFSTITTFSSTAFATESCLALKNSVDARGSYTYHYKDRSQPTLDLYIRYVKSSTQCNSGNALESRAVPALRNCYIPTCIAGYGHNPR